MKRRGGSLGFLSGAALGGGLMYLLDPDRGNRRRAQVRDKIIRGLHVGGDVGDKAIRDLRNRARGAVAEFWASVRNEPVDDAVLEQRIRAKLGRVVSHPNSIEVRAENGRVSLSGPVLAAEVDELLWSLSSVRGVRDIENRLDVHKEAGNVPGLQGGRGRPRGERFELLQENWAPATRVLMGTAGASLLASSIWHRRLRAPLGVLGGTLLLRAITNQPVCRALGLGGKRRGIKLQKTFEINAPVEKVYGMFANPENFPKFMAHVREVKKTAEGRFHWTGAGPAGLSASWESEMTENVPNQVVAWRSVPGSLVRNAGVIRFMPSATGTRVGVTLSYNPPGGALGRAVAALFGRDPKHTLEDDMVRLKSLLEVGKTRARGERVTRQQVTA